MQPATLSCPNCGRANQPGRRFCGGCASPLPVACPACGAENSPEDRFCGYCATPLAGDVPSVAPPVTAVPAEAKPVSAVSPSRSVVPAVSAGAPRSPAPAPPGEERRLVTVLFCDLVGFTPISERLDPEEVRDLQERYFEQMHVQIDRFGGTVEKYAGDAVLALFGVPLAHEDDAERAVLCALGMQAAIEPVAEAVRKRWQIEPAIRVGVNTGEVVSGAWQVGGRQDAAVSGDAVNTAARIQAAAEPGEVLVGRETMLLARRRVRFGGQRDLVLKGKVGTVPAYPALEQREQLGERWEEREQRTPLVGRDQEMMQLLEAWLRAQAGEGQLLTLVGDAGVGKSRLMSELVQKATASATTRIVRGRCVSYGQQISLWLVSDLLRALLALREQDPLAEIRDRLSAGLVPLLADAETRAEAVDVLGEVLGLPPGDSLMAHSGAQIRRQVLIRSVRLVLRALSERSPTLIMLEDLHWVDAASQEVLGEVLADVPGLRILVLAAQRPGWMAPWAGWGWPERLTLRPLPGDEAVLLAGAVLGGAALSPELARYLAERAGGNPFFVEELLRSLEESGDLALRDGRMQLAPGALERLPSTLTEVLLARLDRLDEPVRNTARVASVVGRNFAVRLLAQVMDIREAELEEPLTALQRAEIAFPRRGGALEYAFKHVSMRDVAYNTLVQRRRRQLHLATARAIAQLYPADEYVEMIAYHYSRTEERDEAAVWLEKAGDRAAAVYANVAAIEHYGEARRRLEAAGAEPAALARLDEKLGAVLSTAARYDEALTVLEGAAEMLRQGRDLEGAGRVIARVGMAHRRRGTPEEGIVRVQSMIDLLAASGPSAAFASLYLALSHLFFLTGRHAEVRPAAERAGELAAAVGDERLLAAAMERKGLALASLGRLDEAYPVLSQAIKLAEQAGDLEVLGTALGNLGEAYRLSGDLAQARLYSERALELAQRTGDPTLVVFFLMNLGEILLSVGDWRQSRIYLEEARGVLGSIGSTHVAAYPPLLLARLSLVEGDLKGAARSLAEAQVLAERSQDRQALDYLYSSQAEIDLLEGRPQDALARLVPLLSQESLRRGVLLWALAAIYLALADLERAAGYSEEAVQQTRDQQQRLYLVDALRVRAAVLVQRGQWHEARPVLDEGLALARSMPDPYAEARMVVEDATMHLKQGDRQRGRELLQAALAIFQRLGAARDIERTQQALTELGEG